LVTIVVVAVIGIAIYAMLPPPYYLTFQGTVTITPGYVPTEMTFYSTNNNLYYANLTGSGNNAAYVVSLPNFYTYSVTIRWSGPQGTSGSEDAGVVIANSDILHSTIINYNFNVSVEP
jgi:hypothetical protein